MFYLEGMVDKSEAFAPTYPRFVMRKSDLCSSWKNGKVMCWFYAFERSMLTDKSKEDRFKALDLKTVHVKWLLQTKLGLWVDFSLSLTLIINQFIQGNFHRKMFDWFFWLFYYYFFQRYFDYFIIILLFDLTEVTMRTIG